MSILLTEYINVTDRRTDGQTPRDGRLPLHRNARLKQYTSASARCIESTNVEVQLKLYAAPRHPPPFSKAKFPSLTACLASTQGIENDVSARLPNITSASYDLDL